MRLIKAIEFEALVFHVFYAQFPLTFLFCVIICPYNIWESVCTV